MSSYVQDSPLSDARWFNSFRMPSYSIVFATRLVFSKITFFLFTSLETMMSTRSLIISMLHDDLLPRRFHLPCFPFHLFNNMSTSLSPSSRSSEPSLPFTDILSSSSLVYVMLFNQVACSQRNLFPLHTRKNTHNTRAQ